MHAVCRLLCHAGQVPCITKDDVTTLYIIHAGAACPAASLLLDVFWGYADDLVKKTQHYQHLLSGFCRSHFAEVRLIQFLSILQDE